jgi:hypothetical protein
VVRPQNRSHHSGVVIFATTPCAVFDAEEANVFVVVRGQMPSQKETKFKAKSDAARAEWVADITLRIEKPALEARLRNKAAAGASSAKKKADEAMEAVVLAGELASIALRRGERAEAELLVGSKQRTGEAAVVAKQKAEDDATR